MKNFYFQKKFSKNKYLKNNKIQNKDEYSSVHRGIQQGKS